VLGQYFHLERLREQVTTQAENLRWRGVNIGYQETNPESELERLEFLY